MHSSTAQCPKVAPNVSSRRRLDSNVLCIVDALGVLACSQTILTGKNVHVWTCVLIQRSRGHINRACTCATHILHKEMQIVTSIGIHSRLVEGTDLLFAMGTVAARHGLRTGWRCKIGTRLPGS